MPIDDVFHHPRGARGTLEAAHGGGAALTRRIRMSSLVVDTNLSATQALNDLNATDNKMATA
ncbi:MAG: hypothetical protein ACRDY3_13400, partial [Acidimicrobiales bacterium]